MEYIHSYAKNKDDAMTEVIDKDRGWNKFKRDMKKIDGSYVKVGLQSGSLHKGEGGEISDLVAIGAIHEFGTKTIPERSFMRTTFDERQHQLNALKIRLSRTISSGRMSVRQGLTILGEAMSNAIKKKITDIKLPPLKNPSEKRTGEGVANPLVDTGQLRSGITYEVVVR